MSIFASRTTSEPIPIPFDPPHSVTVRKLTGREIESAQTDHRDSIVFGRASRWAVTFKRVLEKGAQDDDVVRMLKDPLTGYDRFALVASGLIAWTYPEKLDGAADRAKHIADLSDEAVDFIALEVLRLTKPVLFGAAEDERKNGSSGSIAI